MSNLILVIMAAFSTYGLATLLADYDGPLDSFKKLRASKIGRLFSCNVCLMPYVALMPVIGLGLGFFEYLAVVGAGIVIARSV